jgi:hypothetical protein
VPGQSARFTLPGDTTEVDGPEDAGTTPNEHAGKAELQGVIEALLPSGRSRFQSARPSAARRPIISGPLAIRLLYR